MYNEKDDQIFIRLDPNKESVEFFIAEQPLEMIRANITTKEEIRETVEAGIKNEDDLYAKTFMMKDFGIVMNVFIHVDEYLKIIDKVEKLYF